MSEENSDDYDSNYEDNENEEEEEDDIENQFEEQLMHRGLPMEMCEDYGDNDDPQQVIVNQKELASRQEIESYLTENNLVMNEKLQDDGQTFEQNGFPMQEFDLSNNQRQQKKTKSQLDPRFSYPQVETVGKLAKDYEDKSIYSEDEGIDDYKKGGYHPVYIGEVLNGRYVVLQKLGWGHFSTVWLSKDVKYDTYVAIKVQKSANHYLEAAFDEVEILQKAVKHADDQRWLKELKTFYNGKKFKFDRDDCHVVQLLNAFIYTGPYGRHFCMVFEILGVNLLEIIKRYDYKGIPLPICRKMSRQVLLGLHYLHKYCGIIHTDLKPENVMICLDQDELKQIYDQGQLLKNKEFQLNIDEERRQIKFLVEGILEEKSEAQEKQSEAQEKQSPNQIMGNNVLEIKIVDENYSNQKQENFNEQENTKEPNTNDIIGNMITQEDMENVFKQICEEQNITNNSDKKQLKKKLKRKLKKNIKKNKNSDNPTMRNKEMNNRRDTIFIDERLLKKGNLSQNLTVKIADLGNGCWSHHHFQPEIQTRQYRSPEVILGINYNETADMWSFACMLFEMLTGEFLFDPKKDSNFKKSEDHLALMMEMLNKFPKNYSTIGTNSKKYVEENGNLKKIHSLNFMNLKDLLTHYHKVKESEAQALSDFLMPILNIYPERRANAAEMLNHYWLNMDTTQFFVDEHEIKKNPYFYDKVNVRQDQFHTVVNDQDYEADISGMENEAEQIDKTIYKEDYEEQMKRFDRSFKQVYVGYADGIDLNRLDSTGNWQFEYS